MSERLAALSQKLLMAQDWGSAAVCLMKILITEGQVSFFNFRDKCYTCDPIMFLGLGAQESVLCEEPARIQEFAVSIVPCICGSSSYSLIMSTNQLQRHAFHKRPPGASCKKKYTSSHVNMPRLALQQPLISGFGGCCWMTLCCLQDAAHSRTAKHGSVAFNR